jgi:hypothetical protein
MSAVVKPLGVVEIHEHDRTVHVRTVYQASNNGVEWTQEGMSWLLGHTYEPRMVQLAARLAGAVTAGKVWVNVRVERGERPDDPPVIRANNEHFYGKYLDESLKKIGF